MFKPRIHKCVVEEDGEQVTFYVREAGGVEILDEVDATKKRGERPSRESTRESLEKYVVNEDGSAASKEQIDEMMGARASALALINTAVAEKMGLRRMIDQTKKP